MPPDRPFRIHGVVSGAHFTDRAAELDRIRATLREPGAKLVVYGQRRMGKTSALLRAVERHRAAGGVAFLADLSTATTLADVANRILEPAAAALGRKWKDALADLVARLGVSVTLTSDAATGMLVPSVDVGLRSAPLEDQRASLARALDAINALARHRKTPVGIVLDEFQEIRRFGDEGGEWHLRGIIQHHAHVSYVFAGSEAHVISRMLDRAGAFYKLADSLEFGPMSVAHFARWIDDRLTASRVKASGVGARIIALAGPRTRDVVQVARRVYENGVARGRAAATDVDAALDDVVADQEPLLEAVWARLSPLQQNVLRAVAANSAGLTTAAAARQFGLTSSGATTKTALALLEQGLVVRADSPSGYAFDSPFMRRWVEVRVLPDVAG